jgi:hypothetical protein
MGSALPTSPSTTSAKPSGKPAHSCGSACTSRTIRSCSGRIQQEFGLRELAIEAATALGYQVARTYDDAAMFGLV